MPLRPYNRICLNLSIVARHNTASMLLVLFHEMTHIWQFSRGQRGGHGVGFYRELQRVGVDEHRQIVAPESAAMEALTRAETRYPQMAARWHAMVGNAPAHQREIEERIFNENLKARNKEGG